MKRKLLKPSPVAGLLLLTLSLIPGLLSATAEPVAEILTVRGADVYPPGYLATVSNVTEAVVETEITRAEAEIAYSTALQASNSVAGALHILNSIEGIGYITGYITEFGSTSASASANTNMTSLILEMTPPRVDPSYPGYLLIDVWVWYSENPGVAPKLRHSSAITSAPNEWTTAEEVGEATFDMILHAGVLWECYKHTAKVPSEYASGFLRAYVEILGGGEDVAQLPINIGLEINGRKGITQTFWVGTNKIEIVGGAHVE